MQFRLETIDPKILVGMSRKMSLSKDETMSLWKGFMPRRGEVADRTSKDYISMQVFDPAAGDRFLSTTLFEKWAVVEVSSAEIIPQGMQRYTLTGGKYAVFLHKGPAGDWPKSSHFIYDVWLPGSDFELDQREHFEIIPEGYDPLEPKAEEEIWIPIR